MINLSKIEEIKGFMPNHEGEALMSWAKTFSKIGPLLKLIIYKNYPFQELI